MGMYSGPVCRFCRREGLKLFLKGTRCDSPKCPITRGRDTPPGMHTFRRGKLSEYGVQLREKQKLKRIYGLRERQFKVVFSRAQRRKGNTGEALLIELERRLDNVVLASGFAVSRKQSRQMITHGMIRVNGRRVNIPSFLVRTGDAVTPYASERAEKLVAAGLELRKGRGVPAWLEIQETPPQVKVTQLPTRGDVPIEIQEQMIVELCSK